MAKVKFGAVVTDARKSFDGVTYSKNRYGAYIRNRAVPVQPRTELQLAVRARLQSFSTAFRELTDIQREGWNNLGSQIVRTDSLGGEYNPTGAQTFISVNMIRDGLGEAPVLVAPMLDEPPPVGAVTIDATVDDVIEISGGDLLASADYQVYATGPRSAGSTFVTGFGPSGLVKGGDLRLLANGSPVAGPPVTFNLAAAYLARFGSLASQEGARITFVIQPITPNRIIHPGVRFDKLVTAEG